MADYNGTDEDNIIDASELAASLLHQAETHGAYLALETKINTVTQNSKILVK